MEFEHNPKICINKPTCADPGIFVGGGGGSKFIFNKKNKNSLTTFFFSFLVFNLFYRSPKVYFLKKNVIFQGSRGAGVYQFVQGEGSKF